MSKAKAKSASSSSSSRPHVSEGGLPADLEEMRTRVFVTPQSVSSTATTLAPDAYAAFGVDNDFRMDVFQRDFRIEVQHVERKGQTVVDPVTGAQVVAD